MRRTLAIALILIALLLALPAWAQADVSEPARAKAVTLTLDHSLVEVDLAKDARAFQLIATTAPPGVKVYWTSSNTKIATVKDGLVTVKKTGTVKIGALAKGSKKWIRCVVRVTDSLRPTSIRLNAARVTISAFDSFKLAPTLAPATAIQDVVYASSRKSVATVEPDGTIRAHKKGAAIVRVTSVRNPSLTRSVRVTVKTPKAPQRLAIWPGDDAVEAGKTVQFSAIPTPIEASGAVTWSSSDPRVATVDDAGRVQAIMEGETTITATSRASKKISVSRALRVTWDGAGATIRIADAGDLVLSQGARYALTATLSPAGGRIRWGSTNAKIVRVDMNGVLRAVSPGTVTIKAQAGDASATIRVSVLKHELAQEIPLRYTDITGIAANLAKIDKILSSAKAVVGVLEGSDVLDAADAIKREAVLDAAFMQYRFPWSTPVRQRYWTSEFRGLKDFLPDRVYYGLPYIQRGENNNAINRRYNDKKAVSGGYFLDTGKGYYRMNDKKKRAGMYVGSDCSSFVGMSYWGTATSAAYWRTSLIATSGRYRTLDSFDKLRPGDLIVRSRDHVVMFLYFVDAEKTRMMIIEQGGGNLTTDIHQTVCCSIVPVSKYQGRYKPRRLKSLGMD